MIASYVVSYLEYSCDDFVAERVTRQFDDREKALKYADYLSDDGTLEGVSVYAELIDSDEIPF
tara:strand:- start:90 stop:278 length:189 start_codon:yes stop_codon:yes gene_type:complete